MTNARQFANSNKTVCALPYYLGVKDAEFHRPWHIEYDHWSEINQLNYERGRTLVNELRSRRLPLPVFGPGRKKPKNWEQIISLLPRKMLPRQADDPELQFRIAYKGRLPAPVPELASRGTLRTVEELGL